MGLTEVLELSSIDYILLVILAVFVIRWLRRRNLPEMEVPRPAPVPPLPKQDLTLEELRKYNGIDDEHILFALNGTIYDVSRGRSFYGPGGAYGTLAGRDATRALGTMDAKAVRDEWDTCEDLKPDERESADEWESSFKYKYPTVGKLVKTADDKTVYPEGEMSAVQEFVYNKPKAN